MSKSLILIFLLFSFQRVNGQIWKTPFDTLTHNDRINSHPEKNLKYKSYTITDYDSLNQPINSYYLAFNDEGYQIKKAIKHFPANLDFVDTLYYHYNNDGIFQESTRGNNPRIITSRTFEFNSSGRISGITTVKNDTSFSTRYVYGDDQLLDSIIYSSETYSTYKYDSQNRLLKKERYRNGKRYDFFNFFHPSKRILTYQNCLINKKGESYEPCEVVERTLDRKGRTVMIDSKYDMDSIYHFIYEYKLCENGEIKKLISTDQTGDVYVTNYIRDKHGRLRRINHLDTNGKIYFHSEITYELR